MGAWAERRGGYAPTATASAPEERRAASHSQTSEGAWPPTGRRGIRLLWAIALTALGLRLALLPIGHWWDLTVDYNVFIDLGHNHSPYETMAFLSHIARSARWWPFYEYYAYPPAPLYLYYPLAQLFCWLHPHATYYFPVQGSHAMPSLPWDFYLLFKLPIWAADFAIATVLARMTGTARGFRDYLLNPYVLLISGAWTFDAIMVLGLVLGVYWAGRGRLAHAGIALACGTMVKYVPIVVVPVIVIYLITARRPFREVATFVGTYVLACLVLLGPFWQGLLYVLAFQGQRVGGGMNWEVFWTLTPVLQPGVNTDPMAQTVASFGTPALAIGLLLVYWFCAWTRMSLNRMVLLTLVMYLLATKLVNEQYVLALFPFTWIEARRLRGGWTLVHRAFWGTALLFAIFRVPIDRFFWLLYHTILGAKADLIATTSATGFDSRYIPWRSEHVDAWVVLSLGVWFTVLCLITVWFLVRSEARMWKDQLPIRVTE